MASHEFELVSIHCVQTTGREARAEMIVDFGARGRSSAVQVKPGKTLDLDALREMVAKLPFLGGMLVTQAFTFDPDADDPVTIALFERDSTEEEALAAAAEDDEGDFEFEGPTGDRIGEIDVRALTLPKPGETQIEHPVVVQGEGAHYDAVVRIRVKAAAGDA